MQAVCRQNQNELFGDTDRARYIPSAAPVFDRLRIVQSIAPPPNSIVPAFKTRCRGAIRFSPIEPL